MSFGELSSGQYSPGPKTLRKWEVISPGLIPYIFYGHCLVVIGFKLLNFLFNIIGGGESFAQKREFFYEGLAKLHSSSASSKAYLTIDRPNLIESVSYNIKTNKICKSAQCYYSEFRARAIITCYLMFF